jgi:hypothetical protein
MTVRPSEKADVLYSWGEGSGVTTLSPFSMNHAGAGLGANFTDIETAEKRREDVVTLASEKILGLSIKNICRRTAGDFSLLSLIALHFSLQHRLSAFHPQPWLPTEGKSTQREHLPAHGMLSPLHSRPGLSMQCPR